MSSAQVLQDILPVASNTASPRGDAGPRPEPEPELSIVLPCLNEAETIATCVDKAMSFLSTHGVRGEVVVADNGSTDGSRAIAIAHGARVVEVAERGYGAALQAGIAAARGRYVVMGDADDSYDFLSLGPFLEALREGSHLVMGNRFRGGIAPGAMPFLHRYLGNPVLSFIGRLLFGAPVGDFHCGLRAFDRRAIRSLDLRTTGMEFASEMVVRAALAGLRIAEVPTTLSKDGRSRPPHLRTWRDGWRHLRFLLMYSPRWLFLYPGLALFVSGLLLCALLVGGPLRLAPGLVLDLHTLTAGAACCIVGVQSVSLALVTRIYATAHGLLPAPALHYRRVLDGLSLERLVLLGLLVFLAGFGGFVWAVSAWQEVDFGDLWDGRALRVVIVSAAALAIGAQLMLTGFLAGIVALPRRP